MDATAGRVDRRRFPWAVAFIVAVLGVLAGIVIAVALHRGSQTVRPPHVPPVAGSALQAGDVTFRDMNGAMVPLGSAGPHMTAGGRTIGFDHSEPGAVLAALNIPYAADSSAGPTVFTPTIEQQVVGADAAAFLAAVQADYNANAPDSPAALAAREADHVGPWAYRVDAYSAGTASIEVVIRQDTAGVPGYFNVSWVLQWVNGDWRLVAPLNGQLANVLRQVPQVPTGYTVLGRG